MKIREMTPTDVKEVWQLFHDTVRNVNIKDYTPEQVVAWAPDSPPTEGWWQNMLRNIAYVVTIENKIVGFCDMTKEGYLDRLFVHKDFQGKGIASILVNKIEEEAQSFGIEEITTEASITARPFFEAKGFSVEKEQTVTIRETDFINYFMKKKLP